MEMNGRGPSRRMMRRVHPRNSHSYNRHAHRWYRGFQTQGALGCLGRTDRAGKSLPAARRDENGRASWAGRCSAAAPCTTSGSRCLVVARAGALQQEQQEDEEVMADEDEGREDEVFDFGEGEGLDVAAMDARVGLVLDDEAEDEEQDEEDRVETTAEVERLKQRFTQRRHEGIMKLRERASRRARGGTAGADDDDVDVDDFGGASGVLESSGGAGEAVAGSREARNTMLNVDYSVDPRTLKRGEYIVHEKIGIGIFESIVSVANNDASSSGGARAPGQEYIVLQFQDGLAKLKLENADGVMYRYFADEGEGRKAPKLNRLKDRKAWYRRFSKARSSVQDMVVNVMNTYVQRLSRTRAPYDCGDCSDFDGTFEYDLTEDQASALGDIERDLCELDSPMDRLIIGDVGFGKTEVALRAIYRACQAGKQVYVLSPTTVLADQHFRVMSERLNPFGFKTALMCRYISTGERRKVKEGVEDGRIDVVIATHTLLSANFEPRRLGLVVIDEEQKFGVKQKEFLKNLRTATDVDVLTLSATPIPRTLHLSLSGFKDASLIVTPPPGRLAVDTTVCSFDNETVIAAISRELKRGGQVFYVTSRVGKMTDIYERLQGDFPNAKIDIVHGRLSPAALEKAMEGLRSGSIDVMICTTVVESGIDVPNVNTVIVENVHMFGLASLYQIRGRVGRSNKQAYAIFMWPEKMDIDDPDHQTIKLRLKALSECTGLGEGFQLAERDMAIRGIGNVFGDKQSGHLDHVGSDYFVKILCEQLARIENAYLPRVNFDEVVMRIPYADIALPTDFLESDSDRSDFAADITDAARTGKLKQFLMYQYQVHSSFPPAVLMFIKVLSIQKAATDLGIYRINFTKEYTFHMYTDMPEETWLILYDGVDDGEPVLPREIRKRLSFSSKNGIVLRRNEDDRTPAQYLQSLYAVLRLLKKSRPSFVKYV